MSEAANQTQLVMYADLSRLPKLELPQSITIRAFNDGDELAWNNIISNSFNSVYDFNSHMRKDPAFKTERVLFGFLDGKPVATASAWLPKENMMINSEPVGANTGYVHMVGTLPEYRGYKLGYWVSLAVLHKLKYDGYIRAALHTDDFRLPAIKTYLNLGFEIDMTASETMPERWEMIKSQLKI